jgi:glycine/D-amino acid oxidase-like deaminating enzyme
MRSFETVIVGGGIAGLACARRLRDAGRAFVLITDRLGGRMYASPAGGLNHGATYITSDYRHVSAYVDRGARIRLRDIYFRDRDRWLTIFHPHNLRHRRALVALCARLLVFRHHLNRLRRRCPWTCQARLLSEDALLQRYVAMPARSFIEENGLIELNEVFTESMVRSTVFVGTDRVNAFYYLATLMPIVLPTFVADFSATLARLTAGYTSAIVRSRALAVEECADGQYCVHTAADSFRAANLVVATPCHNIRRFYPALDRAGTSGVQEISMCTLHLLGCRRREYLPGKTVFLPTGHPATILFPTASA